MAKRTDQPNRFVPALIIGGVSGWVYSQSGPLMIGDQLQTIPAIAGGMAAIAGIAVISDTAKALGGLFQNTAERQVKGLHGTAGFIKHRWQIWREHKWFGWHPYWGTLNGKPLFFDYESVALTIGPPGYNKSTAVGSPNILCIRESKIIPSFKGTEYATLAKPLRDRGENVILIDLGNLFPNEKSHYYNPTSQIVDNLHVSGGLLLIVDDASSLALRLIPERMETGDENKYFRDGPRDLLLICLLIIAIVSEYRGTLAEALSMLSDRKVLLKNCLWVAGRLERASASGEKTFSEFPLERAEWAQNHTKEELQNLKTFMANLAGEIADHLIDPDPKGIGSFLTAATQSLRRYNITTHINKVTSKNTFRPSDLKKEGQVTTVIITADASRYESQKEAHGLMMSLMLQELQRSPNKHVPVTFIADEATNYEIPELRDGFLSWSRGFGIKVHIIIQFTSEFRRVYGDEAFKALLNAAEIIQFLPGQSEPEVLKLIEDMLGQMSVMSESKNSEGWFSSVNSRSFSEMGRPQMTMDEIRRSTKTILFVRQLMPILTELPQIFAIEPFRKQIEPDPFHGGKRYLQRVKLRLNGRDGPFPWRLLRRAFSNKHKGGVES